MATSVVGFYSNHGGATFHFGGIMCNASWFRGCGECCNENNVAVLSDGETLMSVFRMGAGDGLIFNKALGINGSFHFYGQSFSHDGGKSWSRTEPMPGMGCALPRLLSLGRGRPLMLAGGRMRNLGTNDILLWVSADGMGRQWDMFSLSYWHNKLLPDNRSADRFSTQINATTEPRESSSYTSLMQVGESSFVVTYDRRHVGGKMHGDTIYAMRVDVDV